MQFIKFPYFFCFCRSVVMTIFFLILVIESSISFFPSWLVESILLIFPNNQFMLWHYLNSTFTAINTFLRFGKQKDSLLALTFRSLFWVKFCIWCEEGKLFQHLACGSLLSLLYECFWPELLVVFGSLLAIWYD